MNRNDGATEATEVSTVHDQVEREHHLQTFEDTNFDAGSPVYSTYDRKRVELYQRVLPRVATLRGFTKAVIKEKVWWGTKLEKGWTLSAGTGVVWEDIGHIVTNYNVALETEFLLVQFGGPGTLSSLD